MTTWGLDSYAPVAPQAAKDAGYIAVGAYLAGNEALTPERVKEATAAGVGIFSTWELSSTAAEGGSAQGAIDAQAAIAAARKVGQPTGTAIYMTNDSEVTNWAAVTAYFATAARYLIAADYAPGFYGQTILFDAIKKYGYRYFWHAPDGTVPPSWATMVQSGLATVDGISVDRDLIHTPDDFGAWNGKGKFPLPHPPVSNIHVELVIIHPGSSKESVRSLQGALNAHGANLVVDGIYGPSTSDAVRSFQRAHKIAPADWCGGQTYQALFPPVV